MLLVQWVGTATRDLLLGDLDLALHASVVVAWVQARKIHITGFGELPDDFALFAWCEGDLAGLVMLHLGKLLHGLVVLLELGLGAQTELVLDLATVLDHELDGFALLDGDCCRREAHGVSHVHVDRAGHLGSFAGLTNGWLLACVAVTTAVSTTCKGVEGQSHQGGGCDQGEGAFHSCLGLCRRWGTWQLV